MRKNLMDERIGEVIINKNGSKMIVEIYNSSMNVLVKFINSNYKTQTTWDNFKKGLVRNPYDKTVYGVGYLGEGEHKTKENRKMTKKYDIWTNMLRRCYSGEFPNYKDVIVCDEWHNFQVFSEWYNTNFYEVDKERTVLDKDILIKNNKIYSPDTCIFVPQRINSLFAKPNLLRCDLPIGVEYNKKDKKYRTNWSNSHKGYYDTPEEAFYTYKNDKERYIKQIAEEYKNKIPKKLFNAMNAYIVEITD